MPKKKARKNKTQKYILRIRLVPSNEGGFTREEALVLKGDIQARISENLEIEGKGQDIHTQPKWR